MFLREYHPTKGGKRHTCFALVESQRTERGPQQRIIAQLGELTRDQQRTWQRTAIFHGRHQDGGELPLFVDEGPAPLPDDPDIVRIHRVLAVSVRRCNFLGTRGHGCASRRSNGRGIAA